MKHPSTPSSKSAESLISGILNEDEKIVETLLQAAPELAGFQFTAARLFDSQIFHWIYVGDTILHLAAAGHRTAIVRQLLRYEADPNAASNHRRGTPLHYASDGFISHAEWNAKKQVATLEILLRAGADLKARDKNGATALHRAVRTRCSAAVRFLLKAGSDPLAFNNPGSTPFHLAVQNTGRGGSGSVQAIDAQREIIAEFLNLGISPESKTRNGKSVIESALQPWIRKQLGSNR